MNEKTFTRTPSNRKKRRTLLALTMLVIMFQVVSLPLSYSAPSRMQRRVPKVKTIRIGVISPFDEYVGYDEALYKEILEPEINEYMNKLSRNGFKPATQVEFIIESASWDPGIHLEKVKQFHKDGVNLIIGGLYSYLAEGSLEYINTHDMVMISAGATSNTLALEDDHLFRLVPNDNSQAKAIAAMLHSKGLTEVVIIQRDDNWGNGVVEAFTSEYSGTILGTVAYPVDSIDTLDFSPYMTTANALITGDSDEGVLVLSLDEAGKLLQASQSYTQLSAVEWFGADGTADSPYILADAPDQAANVKVYSTLTAFTPETFSSSKHQYMKDLVESVTGYPFGFVSACELDAGWLLTLGVLESQSTIKPRLSGREVAAVIPDIASRYYGYSGLCELDAAGDRVAGNYDIHGYGLVEGIPDYVIYGMYNTASDTIIWNP